jgi:hypothetical protein
MRGLDEATLRAVPGFGACRFERYGALLLGMGEAFGE